MRGTVVGVLRGGPGDEHEVSLGTGHAIISNLPESSYTVRDIYIDKQGTWHAHGRPITPAQALRQIDMALIALHGTYGEDGQVQKLLEQFGVPYAGSAPFASHTALHKVFAKEQMTKAGALSPRYRFVENGSDVEAIVADAVRTFSQPVMVKPVQGGSSIGIVRASGHAPIFSAVMELLPKTNGVLIEEYVRGQEATVAVVEDFREEKLYSFPVVEVLLPEGDFFSYDAKYGGVARAITPATFPKKITDELKRLATLAHSELGLRDYSRSDFIVSPRGIYYLETNTLPALGTGHTFSTALESVGFSIEQFLEHLISRTLRRKHS